MPEIINRERVQAKLQEFDERVKGAFAAMETMVGLKGDAAKLVNSIKESQEDSAGIRQCLQEIQAEWEDLKLGVSKSREDTEKSGQDLLKQFNKACGDIDRRFNEETKKLRQANKDSRSEHAQLVEESKAHAEKTANDSNVVLDLVSEAEQLLTTIKQDLHQEISSELKKLSQELIASKEGLHAEIDGRLTKAELLTDKRLGEIDNDWKKRAGSLEMGLEEKLASFKEEVRSDLITHQQGVERQITEFLAKQNLLVQNLTQQIDGFQRVAQTLASEQQMMSRKISTLEAGLGKIPEQEAEIGTLRKDMQAQGTRLEQIINGLKGIPIIKNAFKGL